MPHALLVKRHGISPAPGQPRQHPLGRRSPLRAAIALPFIDRRPERHWLRRPVAMILGAAVVAFLIVLTILETLTTPAQHLMGD